MSSEEKSGSNRRRHDRLELHLEVEGRAADGEYKDLTVLDFSTSGMQVRIPDFHLLEKNLARDAKHVPFEIRLKARMAWAEPEDGAAYVTGWEFDLGGESEERVG